MTSKLPTISSKDRPKLVVGIGASAGGIEACKQFLSSVPLNSGMTFVVILHLDPSQKSYLANLLRNATQLKVVMATKTLLMKANYVYVIEPGTQLEIEDGKLKVIPSKGRNRVYKPIDSFFSSLANHLGDRVAAIVMSGTGDDGSTGIQDVHSHGGFCLVEDPSVAQFNGMPESALATGCVDEVLSPEAMPEFLINHLKTLHKKSAGDKLDQGSSDTIPDILKLLSEAVGVNLQTYYRRGTLERRILRRMGMRQISDESKYLKLLRSNPKELAALYAYLLVQVTEFFRDTRVWQYLHKEVIPNYIKQSDRDKPIRIWVAGCATGEEAYSLAMVFTEQLNRMGRSNTLQIFATDISESALEFARQGVYPLTIQSSISVERLSNFFFKDGKSYVINENLRDKITFAKHNLLMNPPFTKIDFISCRNLLIYLNSTAQHKILETFHFALKPEGVLLLGGSETNGLQNKMYEPISRKYRIYRSIPGKSLYQNHLNWVHSRSPFQEFPKATLTSARGPRENYFIERLIMSRYTKPCVLVDENLQIQSFYGPIGDFLSHPTGEARMDLKLWVDSKLYPQLRAAILKVRDQAKKLTLTKILLERNDGYAHVNCTIETILMPKTKSRVFLIALVDTIQKNNSGTDTRKGVSDSLIVSQLKSELKRTQEELLYTIEQLETTVEENLASHEELLSLNEELQSGNEELEVSKEELHSLNEELTTVNQQLQEKNGELLEISADFKNILESSGVPFIFLDRNLCIRQFTPVTTELLSLVPSDIGRSIENIKDHFIEKNLVEDSKKVLSNRIPLTSEIRTENGLFLQRQIVPYRSIDNRIDGVCITFADITTQKQAEEDVNQARMFAESIVSSVPLALLVLDKDLRIVNANDSFYEIFGISKVETSELKLDELAHRYWNSIKIGEHLKNLLEDKEKISQLEVQTKDSHSNPQILNFSARKLRFIRQSMVLLSIEDVTAQKYEEIRHLSEARAEHLLEEHHRKDEFLAMLGHELRNPLSALTYGLKTMEMASGDPLFRIDPIREMMSRQAERIGSMLDQLLDVARLNAGKVTIILRPVDLVIATQTAIESVKPQIKDRNQELIISLPALGTVYVLGDLTRLTQIVENLLDNASKYDYEKGKIWITLIVEENCVELRIRDSGLGMDKEFLPYVFDLFAQAPRTLDRSAGGLGLGLPIVGRLVEMHGGKVVVSSEGQGKGSEFVVTLPLSKESSGVKKNKISWAAKDRKSHQPLRILIVDDEKEVADLLSEMMNHKGYITQVAYDGLTALRVSQDFKPEVVLLDLGMPKMDGYQLAKLLRKNYKKAQVLILALTGYHKDDKLIAKAGIDGHFLKPVDFNLLFSVLDNWNKQKK